MLLLAAFAGGCQSHTRGQSLPPELSGDDPQMQMDFWHVLPERKVVSNDEAFHALLLFVDAPDRSVQEARLRGRGDDEERIRQRLAKADEEVALARELGVVTVVNDDLDRAVDEIRGLIDAHRSRSARSGC